MTENGRPLSPRRDFYEVQDELWDDLYRALRVRAVVREAGEHDPAFKQIDADDPVYRLLDRLAEHEVSNPEPQELYAFLLLANRIMKLYGVWARHFGDIDPDEADPVAVALSAFVDGAAGLLLASEQDDPEYHRISLP